MHCRITNEVFKIKIVKNFYAKPCLKFMIESGSVGQPIFSKLISGFSFNKKTILYIPMECFKICFDGDLKFFIIVLSVVNMPEKRLAQRILVWLVTIWWMACVLPLWFYVTLVFFLQCLVQQELSFGKLLIASSLMLKYSGNDNFGSEYLALFCFSRKHEGEIMGTSENLPVCWSSSKFFILHVRIKYCSHS